ncbi:hypothetical protein DTO271G3_937 [Paecilomyces variotii]|nr:hypothetical protein DTO271G3_937 [Paecilomyces variotii]
MASGIITDLPIHAQAEYCIDEQLYPAPLKPSGSLDKFAFEETTPVIGREFPNVNIVNDILNAPNSDELVRDLAITISQRGVVFFRAQDNLDNDLQKKLVQRLGQLAGKPASSTLHIHPVFNNTSEFGVSDSQINSAQWHSDIQFEPVPADYTSLRLTQLPSTGGDTLWASGYEIYDRFSTKYQEFFESLTATFTGDGFLRAAERNPTKVKIYAEPRGHPLNTGDELTAIHPVVRTNPVTGWKSIFAIGPFPKYINELSPTESDELLKKFHSVIIENHDLQVRFKWRNKNDIAIWDNRSVFHSATFDYDGLGERFGHRAVGIGEKPYLDPNSTSRTEALAASGHQVS